MSDAPPCMNHDAERRATNFATQFFRLEVAIARIIHKPKRKRGTGNSRRNARGLFESNTGPVPHSRRP